MISGDEDKEKQIQEKPCRHTVNLARQDVTAPLDLRALSSSDIDTLYQKARHYVSSNFGPTEAEDIAIKAIEALFRYQQKHKVRDHGAVIIIIARRLAAKLAVREQQKRPQEVSFGDINLNENAWIARDSSAENVVLLNDLVRSLLQAIERLHSSSRDVVWMRLIEKMSYEAIAEKLDIQIGTARVRYKRAIEKLREDPSIAAWQEDVLP